MKFLFQRLPNVILFGLCAGLTFSCGKAASTSSIETVEDTDEPDEPDTDEPDTDEIDTDEPDTRIEIPDTTIVESDTNEPDADTEVADTNDTEIPDTEIPDTNDTEIPDTNIVDTEVSDTNDTEIPDTNDTNIPDTEIPDTSDATADTGPEPLEGFNPVIVGDLPDPDVLRVVSADGIVSYVLVATSGFGDIPMYTSPDLIHWTRLSVGAFRQTHSGNGSIEINGTHYCDIWAPDLTQVGEAVFMLSFSATRYDEAQSSCPAYRERGGVYVASSSSPTGPFATSDHLWEPLVLQTNLTTCDETIRDNVPGSLESASRNCQGGPCHHVIRLDSYAWQDPTTARWWMGYSWYTNDPPMVEWEFANHGEHVSLVELDANDPFTILCDPDVAQIHIANPHSNETIEALRSYCPRCDEQLAFDRGRDNSPMMMSDSSWAIAEGVSLFRRGNYVYALMSGSAWDSGFYHVYWIAAPTVEELWFENSNRLEGRFLIPSNDQAFGHGSPVLGPDGTSWFYVHHRLNHANCVNNGDCSRDVWINPITFEDRSDSRGDIWIEARFPAEDPSFSIIP